MSFDDDALQSVDFQSVAMHRHATFEMSDTVPESRAIGLSRISSRISMSNFRRTLSSQMVPERPLRRAPSLWQGIKSIITMSWLNVLLFCIPISWALNFVLPKSSKNDTLIFVFSFLSVIPLAKLLTFATDELSLRVGQTLAGLLNATLGNAVELIVSIIALTKCELQIVQSSLVGSILSDILLVLGMCFFAGGVRYSEQGFGVSTTQLNSSLLTISVIAVLLPAAFHFTAGTNLPDLEESKDILSFSRGASVILLFIYGSYLVFQLFSHKEMYSDENTDIFKSTMYPVRPHSDTKIRRWLSSLTRSDEPLSPLPTENAPDIGVASTTATAIQDPEAAIDEEEPEVETPQMSIELTIGLLAAVTALVAVTADWLVDSINGLTESGAVSKEFVGLILLPIASNAAEHVTAVTVSVKDKLTLSLGVAVGASTQIALFVIPFSVILGWFIDKPLTLLFDPFESITLLLSVLVVSYIVMDGKTNWLEGMILMCLYVIIAITFWYYPGQTWTTCTVLPTSTPTS